MLTMDPVQKSQTTSEGKTAQETYVETVGCISLLIGFYFKASR